MKNKIGVAIVSYNSADDLKKCIDSVRESIVVAGHEAYIVVTDNNSKDDSVEVAKKSGTHCIANHTNYGFAKATNQAIKYLLSKHSVDYVLILNPDTVTQKDCLGALLETFNQSARCAAVGPRLVSEDGAAHQEEAYYLREPSLLSVIMFSTVLRSWFIKRPGAVKNFYSYPVGNTEVRVPQIPGAAVLMTPSILEKIGLLDEDYAIWFEDVDWSRRAKKAGYSLIYCPEAVVNHAGGSSFNKWDSADKSVTFFVSMKTYFKKHRPLSYPFMLLIVVLNSLLLWAVTRKRLHLAFVKAFLKQNKGLLPS